MPAYEYESDHKAFVKSCSRCKREVIGKEHELESHPIFLIFFEYDKQTADGLRSLCRECTHDIRTKHRGVEPHNRQAILNKQNGQCPICSREIYIGGKDKVAAACVDHDDTTGKVRGLLCPPCNRGIGIFNHDPVLLNKAIAYLQGGNNEDN